jgi:hypothetical protein
MFDMNVVFEDFLSFALKAMLERHGGRHSPSTEWDTSTCRSGSG